MRKLMFVVAMMIISVGMYRCSNSIGSNDATYKEYEDATAMVADAKTRITEISTEEFRSMYESEEPFILIDVRMKAEHDAGYIPGAVNMPRGALEFRIDNEKIWDDEGMYAPIKEDMLIIYCKSGKRSVLAAETLQKLGYKNVKAVEGGFLKWKAENPDMVEENISLETHHGPVSSGAEDAGGC
jgi:rhodanese-related sulfurtransferase